MRHSSPLNIHLDDDIFSGQTKHPIYLQIDWVLESRRMKLIKLAVLVTALTWQKVSPHLSKEYSVIAADRTIVEIP